MYRLLLSLFLGWWPGLPAPVRFGIPAVFIILWVVLWIMNPGEWVIWGILILMFLSLALYGPDESEKRGYHF